MIELKKVSKSYNKGELKAVNELTLSIQSGEIFGFLGPNGAGKTTTIKMIMGILKPDMGEILLNGINIQKDPIGAKSIIGYVPEEPILYEKMKGIQFLKFIADIFNASPEQRKQIFELAEYFEISDALEEVISSYSHGMKQKLTIISALFHDPEILILDEPIVGLDPKASFRLKEKMKELCSEGKTIFFSTHVMEVAENLCHRVGIINHGSLITAAPLEEIKKRAGEKDANLEKIFLELTDENDDNS